MRLSETATEVMRSSEYMEAQMAVQKHIQLKLGDTAVEATALEMAWRAKRYAVSEAIHIQRSKQESRYETDEDRNLELI